MYFYIITAVFMIAGGILAASNLIIGKKPDAKELIDKLTPYQGWIGVVLFFWGIWDIINSLRMISHIKFIFFIIWISVGAIELLLGFLLGFGLITKYALGKNEQALEKGQQIRGKLAPFQGTLGLIAIIAGIVFVIFGFVL